MSCQKVLPVYLDGRRPQDVLGGWFNSKKVAVAGGEKKNKGGEKIKVKTHGEPHLN